MDKFKDLLNKRMESRGLVKPLEAARVVFLVNSKYSHFVCKKFQNRTLYCEVENNEDLIILKQKEQEYIKQINQLLEQKLVNKIIWRLWRE